MLPRTAQIDLIRILSLTKFYPMYIQVFQGIQVVDSGRPDQTSASGQAELPTAVPKKDLGFAEGAPIFTSQSTSPQCVFESTNNLEQQMGKNIFVQSEKIRSGSNLVEGFLVIHHGLDVDRLQGIRRCSM